ncbi:MAG: hypothetical protein PHQ12_08770 [Chthoniobacteraceae bacterium]|nr:hypothetical protein [Chthoniobacteraceae bacterium]
MAQCDETVKNVERFASWVAANSWLDRVVVELAMPWISYICLDSGSKTLALVQLGEEGWRFAASGEIRKTTEGVTVAVAGKFPAFYKT